MPSLHERLMNLPGLPHHPSNFAERPATWPGAIESIYRFIEAEYPALRRTGEALSAVAWLIGRADTFVAPDPERPGLYVAMPSDEARSALASVLRR